MSERDTLEVVIPAYKAQFLRALLQSLADQTSRNFTVIVSDDASPEPLQAICDEFAGRLPVRHVRFDCNLGRSDLAGHWNRSVALSGAQWVLVPGDDDVLEENCIEAFWSAAADSRGASGVFSFGVRVIDENNRIIRNGIRAASAASAAQFIRQRLAYEIYGVPTAYIFARRLFEDLGGFISFDNGWHSDDATWALFVANSIMTPIEGAFVRWRVSGMNISPQMQSDRPRLAQATLAFLSWIDANRSRLRLTEADVCDLTDGSICWPVYSRMARASLTTWLPTVWRASRSLRQHSSKSLLRHLARFAQARLARRSAFHDSRGVERGT